MSTTTCDCGTPTSGDYLCEGCTKTFKFALVHVGVFFLDLEIVATKKARYGNSGATKGSIGKAQPLVVDLRFVDAGEPPDDDKSGRPRPATLAVGSQLRWDTRNTVVAWCRTVMEEQPEPLGPTCGSGCLHISCAQVRRRRWPEDTIGSMVDYLARQFRWILSERWAVDMFGEFLDLERRLARFVDRPADRWYAGKCSVESTLSGALCQVDLYATTDNGTIVCRGCGTRHDVAERREILLNEAKEYHVTATQGAGALLAWTDYDGSEKKLVDRIYRWRDRGKLDVRDVTSLAGKDRHLYRLGDIQDLLVGDAQSAQSKRIGAA